MKRENPKSFDKINVEWADHYAESGDFTLEDIKEKADQIDNYIGDYDGKLVYQNKRVIVICANVWNGEEGEENFSDPMYIMKRAIIKKEIKEKGA
jgi:hypothetical protein